MEVYADELDEEITPEKRRRYKAKLALNQREQERYSPKYKPRKRATLPYAYDRSPRSGPITQADRDKLRDAAREENPDKPEGPGGLPRGKKLKRQKMTGFVANENYDIYDIILSHLLDEGYAETPEQAEVIMVNMSEDWRESIVEELITEISLKTKMRAYAATQDPDADYSYGDKVHAQGERIRDAIERKHGKKAGKHADAHADSSAWGRTDSRTGRRQERPEPRSSSLAGKSLESQKRTTKSGKMHKTDQKTLKDKLQRRASERRSGETSSTHHPSFYHR
jgi:hypothetical protein